MRIVKHGHSWMAFIKIAINAGLFLQRTHSDSLLLSLQEEPEPFRMNVWYLG